MKLRLNVILTLICVVAFSAKTYANNIVIVDMQRILENASSAKDVREKIKSQRNKYQSQITKQEESLRSDEKKLTQQKSILSQEAFEKKSSEFKKKLIDVQRDVQEKRVALDKSLSKALAQIQEAVLEIVTDLSKEKSFDVALPSSQVLFAKDNLNLTEEVLTRLNKKLPKVTLK